MFLFWCNLERAQGQHDGSARMRVGCRASPCEAQLGFGVVHTLIIVASISSLARDSPLRGAGLDRHL